MIRNSYKRTKLGENLLILMPLLYSSGYIFAAAFYGLGMMVSVIAILLFLYGINSIRKVLPLSVSIYAAYLLAIYSIFSLALSLTYNYDGLRSVLLNPALILPYFCALLVVKQYNFDIVSIIIRGIEISAVLFIFFAIINFKEFLDGYSGREAIYALRERSISFDSVSKNFASCVGLGLLLAKFVKRKTLIIFITAFTINLIMAIFLGRRNIVFTNCLYLLASGFLYIKYGRIPRFLKHCIIGAGLVATVVFAINFTEIIGNFQNPLFETLNERLEVDSRGKALRYFEEDMNSEPIRWIIGKGIDSKYYCPGIEDDNYRRTIEAGWKHIIMKVGIIGFILYVMILLPAAFKKKFNFLTKACGIYILIGLIELYPAGVPTFYLQYILLWIAASICYDNKFAKLSDKFVKSQLLKK